MINLISNEIKKNLKKNFYIRLLITFFIVINISFFVVILTISPLFFFSLSQKKIINNQLISQNNSEKVNYEYGVENFIKNLDSKLKIFNLNEDKNFIVSNKIKMILSKKIDGVKITDIYYTKDENKGNVFKLRGSASSRETLLAFKNILQKENDFKSIDLPISSFIQKTNIQFNLTLISS